MPPGIDRPANERPASVMVVEDEFLIAMDLQAILEQNGYRVIGPAASVDQALQLLEAETPDAAVLDVNLRGQLITPVAAELRHADIPYLYSSAYGAAELASFGIDDLAAPHLGKPVDAEHLLIVLSEIRGGLRDRSRG